MSDWLLNLPVLWMAVVVFAATYLFAASIYRIVQPEPADCEVGSEQPRHVRFGSLAEVEVRL